MRAHIEAIGVLAPGITGWEEARAVVSGERALVPAPVTPPAPKCLPPAERRRSSATARLAIAAAEQALEASSLAAPDMAMVFAASEAAGDITHQLCEVLAGTREVSPTLFHNSVHNAPQGYFSIATGARLSGTSLCRGEWTFATGIAYAALQAEGDARPVLFVSYDTPLPPPLRATMPIVESTAIALILSPVATAQTLATWELSLVARSNGDAWPAWIPASWHANASARGFAALGACMNPAPVRLPFSPELDLEVRCVP